MGQFIVIYYLKRNVLDKLSTCGLMMKEVVIGAIILVRVPQFLSACLRLLHIVALKMEKLLLGIVDYQALVIIAHQVILIGALGAEPAMVQMVTGALGMVLQQIVILMETVGMWDHIYLVVLTVALVRHADVNKIK